MIALFARQNHPHGFGYSAPNSMTQWPTSGIGAHGYSVVGIRCRSTKERDKVLAHVRTYGINLPDSLTGRTYYHEEAVSKEGWAPGMSKEGWAPGNLHYTNLGQPGIFRWYSGGPGDWDYLFTIYGSKVEWGWPGREDNGSRGDNRWAMIYDAKILFEKNFVTRP